MWVFLLVGVFLILMGLAVHVLKWHFLISGYNTMPKDKKANVDVEGLGRLMGIYSYINGGFFILTGLLRALGLKIPTVIAFVVLGVSTLFLIIRSQKYDKNVSRSEKGNQSVWVWVLTLVFVAGLMFFATRPTKISVLDQGVQIHGLYGGTYSWDSIQSVSLEEKLPNIERRTNGSAVGSNLRGHFRTTELGKVKLFVDTKKQPFIYLESDKGTVIFNMNDEESTLEIFQEILNKIESIEG